MTERSWLPQEVATDGAGSRPWAPADLPAVREERSYIVIEEILGGSIGLAVSAWPQLDERGRMHFAEPARLAGVDRDWLERQLAEHRQPSDIGERPLRIGDVFAVAGVELTVAAGETELTITSWKPPIYDLTAEARAAAKTALYAAVAPVLDPEQADDLEDIVDDVEEVEG